MLSFEVARRALLALIMPVSYSAIDPRTIVQRLVWGLLLSCLIYTVEWIAAEARRRESIRLHHTNVKIVSDYETLWSHIQTKNQTAVPGPAQYQSSVHTLFGVPEDDEQYP